MKRDKGTIILDDPLEDARVSPEDRERVRSMFELMRQRLERHPGATLEVSHTRGRMEPDDEPECDCKTRGCERFACKGQCGCRSCHDAYQDFLSLE